MEFREFSISCSCLKNAKSLIDLLIIELVEEGREKREMCIPLKMGDALLPLFFNSFFLLLLLLFYFPFWNFNQQTDAWK